ncbi:MAG TPA: exodeoxyribonuclease VII small subunit [Solirubrobacteraceae bacterium]|jgi:exodeoxyribonuclease VII small subunit
MTDDPLSVAGSQPLSTDSQPIADPQPAAGEPQSMTYETAAARVEEIIRRLDSGEASLNETLALVQEGKTLIELCAGELESVGAALEELRLDELVARLEDETAK